MTIKIKKWGNSLGIRIPHTLVKEMDLSPEQEYEIVQQDSFIILRPLPKQPTLDELLVNMSRTKKHEEQVEDYLGKEQWWKEENTND